MAAGPTAILAIPERNRSYFFCFIIFCFISKFFLIRLSTENPYLLASVVADVSGKSGAVSCANLRMKLKSNPNDWAFAWQPMQPPMLYEVTPEGGGEPL